VKLNGKTVIYPGSFDPVTKGHLDVIRRAARLFDKVVVAVAINDAKVPLFSLEERKTMLRECTTDLANVEIDSFDGLLAEYVKEKSGDAVIRGLRAVSDFEFEFQLALINRRMNENFETIFMMPKEEFTFLSSSIVKTIARLGGNVSEFVPPNVESFLKAKFQCK
jgi:pantetheine-phosphate adenylyltransferase